MRFRVRTERTVFTRYRSSGETHAGSDFNTNNFVRTREFFQCVEHWSCLFGLGGMFLHELSENHFCCLKLFFMLSLQCSAQASRVFWCINGLVRFTCAGCHGRVRPNGWRRPLRPISNSCRSGATSLPPPAARVNRTLPLSVQTTNEKARPKGRKVQLACNLCGRNGPGRKSSSVWHSVSRFSAFPRETIILVDCLLYRRNGDDV